MSPAEIAAYIGAAAWLPQIGVWAVKSLTKPKLNLKLNSTILLTYHPFATSAAVIIALSAERRDAFVTGIKIRAIHERGEECVLQWALLQETLLGIVGLPEQLAFENSQPALALKVSTLAVTQKTVWFWSDSKSKSQEVIANLQEHADFLKTHSQEAASELLRSKELAQTKDRLAENLFWREGNYTCELEIYESSRTIPVKKEFSFLVTKSDAAKLRTNLNSIDLYLRQVTLRDVPAPKWERCIIPLRDS